MDYGQALGRASRQLGRLGVSVEKQVVSPSNELGLVELGLTREGGGGGRASKDHGRGR